MCKFEAILQKEFILSKPLETQIILSLNFDTDQDQKEVEYADFYIDGRQIISQEGITVTAGYTRRIGYTSTLR